MTGSERRAALARAAALTDAGRLDGAAAMYAELLRAEPDDVQALCGLSRCLGKQGRPREGLELAGRAAALSPADDWPHRLRSSHLALLGRGREALEAARTAVAQDPDGLAPLLCLFEAQLADRDPHGASATASRMLERFPGHAEAHNSAGRAALLRRDLDAAEPAFREALRMIPVEPVYQSNLALALEHRGHRQEAMRLFEHAVRVDPGSATARRQLVLAIDRRLALVGAGVAVVAGLGAEAAELAGESILWPAVAAAVALLVAAAAGLRWWRLRRLDERLRVFYRHERRRTRGLRREAGVWLLAALLPCLVLVVATARLSRSPELAAAVALALTLLLRFPALHLWRRRVLPGLRARHGLLRTG